MKNENLKLGFTLLGKYIFCLFLAFFINISFTMIITAVATENIGYNVSYYDDATDSLVHLYTHYNEDGADTKYIEYEAQGYSLSVQGFRSEPNKVTNTLFLTLCQIILIVIVFLFFCNMLFYMGDSDCNKVNFGQIKEDKLKGLKIGLVPFAFQLIPYLLLFLGKLGIIKNGIFLVFRLCNFYLNPIIMAIVGNTIVLADISWSRIFALLPLILVTPILSFVLYYLGYRRINVLENIVYKKEK